MPYDKRNLANTVYAGQSPAAQKYRSMRKCGVWREKKFPPFFVLVGEPHEKADSHTNYHEWSKETGRCKHCGLTRNEAREPSEKKGSRLARAIALTSADIPPIQFVGDAGKKL